MKRVLMTVAVSAAFAAVAPATFAETASSTDAATMVAQAAQPQARERGDQRDGAQQQRRFQMPSERVEARLAYARTALKITDAQQPQWENFSNVLRKHAREMDQRVQQMRAQRQSGAQRPNVTAIDRLERAQQRLTERSARLNEVIAAAKPLYASLSPEQKQIADGMLAQHGRGGHRGQPHRGMHHGPRA